MQRRSVKIRIVEQYLFSVYVCICVLFCYLHSFFEGKFQVFFTLYLCWILLYVFLRFFLYKTKQGRALLLLTYFFTLLMGYYENHSFLQENILLPPLIFDIFMQFSFKLSLLLGSILGFFGSIILSYRFLVFMEQSATDPAFFNQVFAFFFITALSAYSRITRKEKIRKKRKSEKYLVLSRHLDNINKNLINQLFIIKESSYMEERKRITKEIHDTAGYVFTNIIMTLQAAEALLEKNREKALEKISEALTCARGGINEIRHILRELREYEAPVFSLQNELYKTARLFNNATAVTVNLEYGNWPKSFGQDYDRFFISLLQESLTNSIKHGYATFVEMQCWCTEKTVSVQIHDNGKGAKDSIQKGIGLTAICDFVEERQGLTVFQNREKGFSISIQLPQP